MDAGARKRIAEYLKKLEKRSGEFLGFPGATDFDYSDLYPFFKYLLNNVGDPYIEPLHVLHSAGMEREVVGFFAELFRAPQDDYWGYVSAGGTEGNLYGLYLGRETLPAAKVFYSDAAHYSIPKNIDILRQEPIIVRAQDNGEMDYNDLKQKLQQYQSKQAIILATIGTTMTEAKDDLAAIQEVCRQTGVQQTYIHSDAALVGVYTALATPRHPFDFADGADSISISGHKFIGSPIPCGVVLTRKAHRDRIERSSSYVGSPDVTITGSRSGHAPIILWYAIQKWGRDGFLSRYQNSLKLADYAHAQLQKIGWEPWRNPGALTVMLKSPPQNIIEKWQLASYQGWSHIICMPGTTQKRIDAFIKDLKLSI